MKALIDELRKAISEKQGAIFVNFINCGTAGPRMKKMLIKAGYKSDGPGCPQQTFYLIK
jgi:hypothetical protein